MAENKRNFYFNEVNIEYGENPHGLMDFELLEANILKLEIDGKKSIDKSSITLSRKELDFPKTIEWEIKNKTINKIALKIEIKDKNNKILRHFWMTNYGLSNNQVTINDIPKATEKIVITAFHENVLNKTGILIITAKN